MNPLDQYTLITQQDIAWGDMDAFQHINNTVYFRYFENVRILYFQKVGVIDYIKQHNIGPILANTECQFRSPLVYPDTISIGVRTHILSPKKFNMEYVVYSHTQDRIAAEGQALNVYYNYLAGNSCEIPESITNAIYQIEFS